MEHRSSDARFDLATGTWVLSHYADVLAALHTRELVATGTTTITDTSHVTVRNAISRTLSPERLAHWRDGFATDACRLVDALPAGRPVDLVPSLAQPWSLEVALAVTGASRTDAEECVLLARQIFVAAAEATNGTAHHQSQQAATMLARLLAKSGSHDNPAADVQTFVALSQTLPALLAGAWLALLRSPHHDALAATLRAQPALMPMAVNELLRVASPSRAVFRETLVDTEIAGAHIHAGDRVTLMLSAANMDPARYDEPEQIDLHRNPVGHLAFGAGPHACAGATLVRMAVTVATEALMGRTATIELSEGTTTPIEYMGGVAIHAPATLPVVLTRTSGLEPTR